MTRIVGIVNVTPDSFSDGGNVHNARDVIAYAHRLIEEGADVIDLGAESTRPHATPLSAEEEWARLQPVLPEIRTMTRAAGVLLSIDTRHPGTVGKAISLGVDWINDVSGFGDPAMIEAVRESSCTLVMMHSLSIPAEASVTISASADPVAVVKSFFNERLSVLRNHNIEENRIILDPGIGFGKTAMQSLALILRCEELKELGHPLLFGHSRKSFLTLFTDKPAGERDDLTLAFSALLWQQGIGYLRVHNVPRHRALIDTIMAGMQHR